jgi:hypothetical protein
VPRIEDASLANDPEGERATYRLLDPYIQSFKSRLEALAREPKTSALEAPGMVPKDR